MSVGGIAKLLCFYGEENLDEIAQFFIELKYDDDYDFCLLVYRMDDIPYLNNDDLEVFNESLFEIRYNWGLSHKISPDKFKVRIYKPLRDTLGKFLE